MTARIYQQQHIPINNDAEYIKLLEDENQLLGSMLAEYEIDHD
jgi:hypothetical protein